MRIAVEPQTPLDIHCPLLKHYHAMKIPLTSASHEGETPAVQKVRKLANDLAAARRSDWGARDRVVHHFTPLIRSLADKRTQDTVIVEQDTQLDHATVQPR